MRVELIWSADGCLRGLLLPDPDCEVTVSWLSKGRAGEGRVTQVTPAARDVPLCGVNSEVIVHLDAVPDEAAGVFRAKVGVLDGDTIVLADTKGETADDGTPVTLRWCTDLGERWVSATVTSTSASTWTVQATGEVVHQQRRAWVRVDTAVPVRIRPRAGTAWHAGRTVNLSCGGTAAVVEVPAEDVPGTGHDIDIELHLPTGPVTVSGAVVQAWPSGDGQMVRMAFNELTDASRDQIARHVFQVHREELARRRQALDARATLGVRH